MSLSLSTSHMRHRLQLAGAIAAAVGSVWVVSCVVNCVHKKAVPVVKHLPTAPVVPVVYVVPLSPPPPPSLPHLTPAFASALKEGDLRALDATYTDESSLGVALKTAAGYGKHDIVRWVLDKGADVHTSEVEQGAPILAADAFPDVVKLLLDRGADEPALSTAAIVGAPNAVTRILAKNKAAATPTDGTTPLFDALSTSLATTENRRIIVEKLLAAGADPNAGETDRTPLGVAIATCSSDDNGEACIGLIHALTAKKARVSGDAIGETLDLDESAGRAKVLDTVLSSNLEPGATSIGISHASGERDNTVIKKIAAKGISWVWHDGEPDAAAPLVEATERQDVALVRAFLDAGAPADYHFKDGRSALGTAIDAAGGSSLEAERIVELLVLRGANVNRRLADGRAPLFAAAETGDVRVVTALLNAGARVNERVLDETALDAAERSGHTSIARVLDGHGARRARIDVAE